MKLVIAGSRDYSFEPNEIANFLGFFGIHPYDVIQVVSGTAKGVDKSGEKFADVHISDKPNHIEKFPPDKDKYGTRAFHIRNNKMAVYGDALLLIWDGKSAGSSHMKDAMLKLKKPIYEIVIRKHNA